MVVNCVGKWFKNEDLFRFKNLLIVKNIVNFYKRYDW